MHILNSFELRKVAEKICELIQEQRIKNLNVLSFLIIIYDAPYFSHIYYSCRGNNCLQTIVVKIVNSPLSLNS